MRRFRERWLPPCLICAAAGIWLVWAFPRLDPAARLGLQFDREGYLAQARGIAARQHVDVTGWSSYAKAETLNKNQQFRIAMPDAPMSHEFPPAQVVTNFLPRKGAGARITLRPEGRPLSWKLPVPEAKADAADMSMASDAMHQMAGGLSSHFAMTTGGVSGGDGMGFKWKAQGTGQDSPALGIEESVRNGVVAQANTIFTMPASVSREYDSFPAVRVVISALWFLLLIVGLAVPILREGGGVVARTMKDRSVIVLGSAAAAFFLVAAILDWDDDLISASVASGIAMEVLGMLLGSVVIGLLFYFVNAATVLNARLHVLSVRGFRLLGSSAFFSRNVGQELLGGWMFAPLIVSIPLAVGLLFRVPAFGGYDDGLLLGKLPALDALANVIGQETLAVVSFVGILIPLVLRFCRGASLRRVPMAALGFLTFAMLQSPFRTSEAANLICAALNGLVILWIYLRFGMLGALAGYCAAPILGAAGALLVQPAAGLQASGWNTLIAFAGLGIVCLVAAVKAPEAVAELYGESGARAQARSRREELLAEFNVARSAQQQMLPSQPPVLPGYTIAASCEPAREVGGDLYDFLQLNGGRWGIGVADVSGKGVPAALYMTLTKGLLCAAAQDSGDPRQILGAVNKHLRTVTKRKMFVTMAFGVLDPEARRMEYVRAGHNPVVWRRTSAGETRFLTGNGIGLGIAGPALFAKTLTTESIDLAPGDALVFYSDGLTEAMNKQLEQFGDDRLAAAVERADGMHATATRDSILREVSVFLEGGHSQDDLTIAVLRVDGTGR
jgi:serine phosphatase RsbU (regulator of sigma subunit)